MNFENAETIGKIKNAVKKYWGPFEKDYPALPSLEFDTKGQFAGQIQIRQMKLTRIRFNLKLAKENIDKFLVSTVPHELGHVLSFYRHGNCKHNPQWRRACYDLGMKYNEITRCHTYEVPRSARKPKDAQCIKCKNIFPVTKKMHQAIEAKVIYKHRTCKAKLIAI